MEFSAAGRLEVRISVADVGKRVSVRRLNEPGVTEGKFTDTVGVLTSWDGGVLTITRKGGEAVIIDASSLVAGKVVPAAPSWPAYVQTATGAEGTQELLCAELERRGWVREVTAQMWVGALAPVADLSLIHI